MSTFRFQRGRDTKREELFRRCWVEPIGRALSEDIFDIVDASPGVKREIVEERLAKRWGAEAPAGIRDLIAMDSLRENRGRLFTSAALNPRRLG